MKYYNVSLYDEYDNTVTGNVISVGEDGRIESVGVNRKYTPESGDIDCHGMLAVPSFFDNAVTVPGAGIYSLFGVNLTHYNSVEEYLSVLSVFDPSKPVRGFGYNTFVNGADGAARIKTLLDEKYPDDPCYVFADDMTTAIVNEAFLEEAKSVIHVNKELHEDGEIDKLSIDMLCKDTSLFDFTDDEIRLAMVDFVSVMLSNGITAVRIIDTVGARNMLDNINNLIDAGLWTLTTVALVPVYPFDTLDEMVDRYHSYVEAAGDNIHIDGITLTLDGSIDSMQAALLQPYDVDDNWRGDIHWNQAKIFSTVKAFISMGINVNINAYGDRAVSRAVAAASLTADKPIGSGTITITHAYLMNSVDIATCSKLGVRVCIEPNLIPYNNSFYQGDEIMLGDRCWGQYPVGRLAYAGVTLLAGSNTPACAEVSPISGVFKAAHRNSRDDITPWQMLHAYGVASYETYGIDYDYGTIDVGKYACFVLLSKDILHMRESMIRECKVKATVYKGTVMWTDVDR